MTAGLLHDTGARCPSCNGTGVLAEPLEERFSGYIDGPAPAARNWLMRVSGWSGLSVSDQKDVYLFGQRFKIRERDAIRDMEDGLLLEHLARLRRQLVMADEDGLDFLKDLTRERFEMAETELRWRKRAGDKGADRMASEAAWRDRVRRVKENVSLVMLIAYENDKARQTGRDTWECCCPFHPDRSPSLSIDTAKALWTCHGCKVGGDCFTYVEMREGLDFAAAVRALENRL